MPASPVGSQPRSGEGQGTTYRRAVKWAFVMNWGQQAISAVLTFALAAFLGVEEFGTASTGIVYVLLIQMALDGFVTAIVQRPDLDEEHLDSSFWMVLGLSLVLTVIGIGLAGWWASVTKDASPSLAPIIRVLSLSIPIRGLTVVQQAILQRRMDFKGLALRANVSTLVGGLLGFAVAVVRRDAWALVVQQLCGEVVSLALLWTVSDWRPRRRFSWSRFRDLLGFSVGAVSGNLGVFAGNRLDSLLIPLYFGTDAVALYRMADRMTQVVLELVTRSLQAVSLPQFAKLQNDPAGLRHSVISTIRMSATATVPAMVGIAVTGRYLLRLMGKDWVDGARTLQLFCAVGIARAVTVFVGPLLQARGRPHTLAILIWVHAGLNALGFLVAAHLCVDAATSQQITGMAAVRVVVSGVIFVPINFLLMRMLCGASIRDLWTAIVPSLASGATIAAVVIALTRLRPISGLPAWAFLAVAVPAGGAAGVSVLLALDRSARHLVVRVLGRLRRQRA